MKGTGGDIIEYINAINKYTSKYTNIFYIPSLGTTTSRTQDIFEDDVSFPKVGYVIYL